MENTLGSRIAKLRAQHGFTQQEVADRLAISRTAVSHLESGISVPSERTIALLAGLFKTEPHTIIEHTSYPLAKAERLPQTVCYYTETELKAQLIERDCAWLERLRDQGAWRHLVLEVCHDWFEQLARFEVPDDPRERSTLLRARGKLEALYQQVVQRHDT
jgi:transcriptional regulator with XRE-family HTH domain